MNKGDFLKAGFDVLPRSADERKTYRMSFQTDAEVVSMIEDAVDAKGTRGALKETLSRWLTLFDTWLEGNAIENIKKVLEGSLDLDIEDIASALNPDNKDHAPAYSLFMLLNLSFSKSSEVRELLNVKNKINKTYALTKEAKLSVESAANKLSIKNSDVFNLSVNVFCRFAFEAKKRQERKITAQANAIWPFVDSFSDLVKEQISLLSDTYDNNSDVFDPELTITDLASDGDGDDYVIENAIGQIVRAYYQIEDAAGTICQYIDEKENLKGSGGGNG